MDEGQQSEQGARVIGFLLVVLSAGLAVIGNLAGNVVVARLPAEWAAYAPLALVGVTFVGLLVALALNRLQDGDARKRRSIARRHWTVVLLAVGELLAVVGGVLTNMAASRLPAQYEAWAPYLLPGVVVLTILVSAGLYLRELTPPVEMTNRRIFLKRLKERYTARRKDALSEAVLLMLGMQTEPEAVREPALAVGTADGMRAPADERMLPEGTTIQQAYEQAGGRLLILGAPGAGKTTQLVELALWLLRQARRDTDAKLPMPVIFNLSTWPINRRPLAEWLVEDLERSYQVPRRQARDWIVTRAVLPLLDGFDEADEARRVECAQAINAFIDAQQHQEVYLPVVACSRLEEYRAQPIVLDLNQAVVLQPLTDERIVTYLERGGEQVARLREVVATDADLREVLRTPLFLRLVALTYAEVAGEAPPAELPPVRDQRAWRRQLFQDYVNRMLQRERRGEERPHYGVEHTRDYLAYLAVKMQLSGLGELSVERLQPAMLPGAAAYANYASWLVVMGGSAATVFLCGVVWFVAWMVESLSSELPLWLMIWMGVGVVFTPVLIVAVVVLGQLRPDWLVKYEVMPFDIEPARMIEWSWMALLRWVVFGLLFFLPGTALLSLVCWALFGPVGGLIAAAFSAPVAPVCGVMLSMEAGMVTETLDEPDRRDPIEEIRRMARSSVFVGVRAGLVVSVVSGLLSGLAVELLLRTVFKASSVTVSAFNIGVASALVYGPASGLVAAISAGGGSIIQHATVRWELRHAGVVPPDLVGFLDYCADHVLLQRVGGRYRFIHILLRDYFADLFGESGHTTADGT